MRGGSFHKGLKFFIIPTYNHIVQCNLKIFTYYVFMYNSSWYYNLIKPPFSPPDWIFSPVWSFLYVTIFAALLLYIKSSARNKKWGLTFFVAQMGLNIVWSQIFFGFKNISLALLVIVLLDTFIILTIKNFYSASKPAGIILIPYLVWILFATYLNFGYFVLN